MRFYVKTLHDTRQLVLVHADTMQPWGSCRQIMLTDATPLTDFIVFGDVIDIFDFDPINTNLKGSDILTPITPEEVLNNARKTEDFALLTQTENGLFTMKGQQLLYSNILLNVGGHTWMAPVYVEPRYVAKN